MFKLFIDWFLYAPPDTKAGGGPTINEAVSDKDDIIRYLGQDDEPPETISLTTLKPAKEKEGKEDDARTGENEEEHPEGEETDEIEETEEVDELDLIAEDLEEPTEDQLELVTPVRRAEILKEFPELFKKFPSLEKHMYRDMQFSEIFPTPADAREASENSQTLQAFESDLLKGDIEKVLQYTKNDHPQSFNRLVDNYLEVLNKVDERAYDHVTGNIISHTIAAMAREARKSNNDALLSAASILNQFIFRTSEYKPPARLSKDTKPEDNEREERLSRREEEINKREFDRARDSLNTRVNNSIEATIAEHIDPKKTMTDYVRRNAIRDAKELLISLIEKDTRFKTLKDRLWDKAYKNNYSDSVLQEIRSAHLSKAKTLLPSVIKKARIDAIRGMGGRVRSGDNTDTTTEKDRRGPVRMGRPESRQTGKIKSAKDIPKGMSTLEFLNSD